MGTKNLYMVTEYAANERVSGNLNVSFDQMKARVLAFGGARRQVSPGMWEVTNGDRSLSVTVTGSIGARRTV